MLRILAMTLALVVFPSAGQTVQKCIGKGGAVSFVSGPCPADQKQAASYDATPEVMTARRARELEDRRRRDAANSRYLESLARGQGRSAAYGSSPSRSNAKHERCQDAKRRRDDTLRRVGLRRTHDLLRRLDNNVYEACK